jgi:DNA repair exonuclease SbcCD nuclease subunit
MEEDMKLLITGDWHLDERRPVNRIDNYMTTQREKLDWIFNLAKKEKVSAILQPGDFFNSFKVSHSFVRYLIMLFTGYKMLHDIPILTVPGQHDMRFHSSDINDTPMGVLEAAGVIKVLEEKPHLLKPGVSIYGAGWKQDIPKGLQSDLNILVTHKLVSNVALWKGAEWTTPKELISFYSYDLYACGDNHKHFAYENFEDGRLVINCGSLMRSAIDQEDHTPVVYTYDTATPDLKRHHIPIKPFHEVMNLEEVEKEKERNVELDSFVEGLSDTNIEGLDFKKNLIDHLDKNKDKIGQGVINIINKVVG